MPLTLHASIFFSPIFLFIFESKNNPCPLSPAYSIIFQFLHWLSVATIDQKKIFNQQISNNYGISIYGWKLMKYKIEFD